MIKSVTCVTFSLYCGSYQQIARVVDKEFYTNAGLNLYDYHARQYEPAIGRFTMIDPHAENYYSISPYAYCANNPIRITDPTGMDWYYNESGEAVWVKSSTSGSWREWQKKSQIWTYIGKTYLGITIDDFSSWTGASGRTYGEITIYYTGSGVVGWIQTVDTDAKRGLNFPSIDPVTGSEESIGHDPYYPYYHGDEEFALSNKIAGYNGYSNRLWDRPNRGAEYGDFYMNYETSLIVGRSGPLEFNQWGGEFGGGGLNDANSGLFYISRGHHVLL